MTSETTTDAQPSGHAVPPFGPQSGLDTVTRAHLLVALGFLAVSTFLAVLAVAQLVLPELFEGVAQLSYGRLFPTATNLFIYGWLTLGMLGAVHFALPRMAGGSLRRPGAAGAALALIASGVAAGAAAVALGNGEGRHYLEAPLWTDAIVVTGLVLAAWSAASTLRTAPNEELGPVHWYLGAAPLWLLLTFIAGNIPGIAGVNSAIQTAFFEAALIGLWLAAAGVGIVYYLVPSLTGSPPGRPTQLSIIGFWSLAFVWALSGAARLTYTPAPDWLETMGVVFAIALLLPVAVIFTDVLALMRGKWELVTDRVALRFMVAGAALFAFAAVLNVIGSLRSVSAVVGYTHWSGAFEYAALYGASSFWLIAFVYHAAPQFRPGSVPARKGHLHYRLSTAGLFLTIGAMLAAGMQQGLTWIASANSRIPSVGQDFRSSVEGVEWLMWVRLAGVALYVAGQLWFVVSVVLAHAPTPAPSPANDADSEPGGDGSTDFARPLTLRRLRTAAVGLFATAAILGWIMPSFDSAGSNATLLADTYRTYPEGGAVAAGRQVYIQEGCWFCHTQDVRTIVTDVGLGAASVPGDYANEVPALLGLQRIGPDLMHTAARPRLDVRDTITDPRSRRSWSTMPSYSYLSEGDVAALLSYIATLQDISAPAPD